MDIQKQVIAMKDLTSQVQHIINMMNTNIQEEEDKLWTNGDDMMIDNDVNKRNLYGKLRDSDGNIQHCDHNKENIPTGGNHNKCNHREIDFVGTCHP
jgi:Skp family chaperone for outer membrane proteins